MAGVVEKLNFTSSIRTFLRFNFNLYEYKIFKFLIKETYYIIITI